LLPLALGWCQARLDSRQQRTGSQNDSHSSIHVKPPLVGKSQAAQRRLLRRDVPCQKLFKPTPNHGRMEAAYPREPVTDPIIDDIVARALAEDVGDGDITTAATVPERARARATITQKAPGVVSGLH